MCGNDDGFIRHLNFDWCDDLTALYVGSIDWYVVSSAVWVENGYRGAGIEFGGYANCSSVELGTCQFCSLLSICVRYLLYIILVFKIESALHLCLSYNQYSFGGRYLFPWPSYCQRLNHICAHRVWICKKYSYMFLLRSNMCDQYYPHPLSGACFHLSFSALGCLELPQWQLW